MSDLTPPKPTLPEPPRRDRRIVWTALASVMLHAGVLALVLWQPLPPSAEAAPPPAIDVVLVPPPEAVSPSEPPPPESPSEEASAEPATAPPSETAESPAPVQAAAPAAPAETSAPEMPAETESPETPSEAAAAATPSGSEAAASAASEPPRGSEASAKVAPIPLSRPVRGLTALSSAPDEGAPALTANTGETAEGTAPAASAAEPDVATLELGAPRSAERFYLEAMLSSPSMERARAMLETLPREKRLAQTCNIEALAQIGNAGEGFAPDVVMAEAYALSEMTGTRLVAGGAIFRSQEKWYGVAFDCTLSDDLTSVTAFSYRLGADVTEAVLARLNTN